MKIDTKRILAEIATRGITRAELAHDAGISRQSISAILLRGSCEPKTIGKVAKSLGVEAVELIKED